MFPGQSWDSSTAMASSRPGEAHSHIGCDAQKVLNEFRNVLPPLSQRRNAYRHHGQPMKKVFAKTPLGDGLRKIAARRGNDAHIDENTRGAADALEVLIDQNAEDLGLRLARHVGDFIQVKRAAVRLFKRADPRLPFNPDSTPNSSASILSGDIVGALMTTKGPLARLEFSWISRAASSLPDPAAPEIRMRELAGPTFR